MNLATLLNNRRDNPIRVGVIGAGKFSSMFLSQARITPGLHIAGLCDLDAGRAAAALAATGWPAEQYAARSFDAAFASGATHICTDAQDLIACERLDVVIDATGDPAAGVRHALACFGAGHHLIMVNVEADVLAGPWLAEHARLAGVVYSLAYGDQPALIAELVDWARATGFEVVCAGKGTKYLPEFHASTPDTVWGYYGLTPERAQEAGMNPKMFNSFLDGTKSAIEMAAVSNATGLVAPSSGLSFPPCGTHELAQMLKPTSAGGTLAQSGTVEVVSSLSRDGSDVPNDLRWGVYVTFEAPSAYVRRCFEEYGVLSDDEHGYAALYRPTHLIGLELGISVASAALRREATGSARGFSADVVAIAKRDLQPGETLDGEGGYTVWGSLTTATDSLTAGALPIGLAHGCTLKKAISAGQTLCYHDVQMAEDDPALRIRRQMEAQSRQTMGIPEPTDSGAQPTTGQPGRNPCVPHKDQRTLAKP